MWRRLVTYLLVICLHVGNPTYHSFTPRREVLSHPVTKTKLTLILTLTVIPSPLRATEVLAPRKSFDILALYKSDYYYYYYYSTKLELDASTQRAYMDASVKHFSVHIYLVTSVYQAVGLKSDGTMGHVEVNMPRATVPSLSTCDGHTTGHWPVALFKRRDRRRDTFNCPSLSGS